ncbi:TBC1 domain family member 16-like [Oppia nitens]|uniref:TBC1 domain family member 16-like n=1 Tax=Oppia nitens TaxID=1686743 RepID=UPI0023DC8F2B|nr:TBC1 domain family member 16-like [Oppia nitens]
MSEQMSARLQSLWQKATNYLSPLIIGSNCQSADQEFNGEVVYSKNNVCVHSTDKHNNQLNHNLGYLTIKTHLNKDETSDDQKWTLCLQWTSNECLTKQFDNNHENCAQSDCDYNDLQITSEDQTLRGSDSFNDVFVYDLNIIVSNDNNNYHNFSNSSQCCDNDIQRRNSMSENKSSDNNISTRSPLPRMAKPVRRCQSCRTTPLKRSPNDDNFVNTFSVDLKQIKSLRVFFGGEEFDSNGKTSSADTTSGQLVIVSRDSFYKVFHYHCGGLDKLLNILNGLDIWDKSETPKETNYLQFSICRPKLTSLECHPEEKLYSTIDKNQWMDNVNEMGQIIDEQLLRKTVFFAGVEPSLRRHIWPFLLKRYEFDSTYLQRESDNSLKAIEYEEISKKLETMDKSQRDWFWRNVESIVEKDVPRTDRTNPFFADEKNDNMMKMKRILINFSLYCPQIGYTQGMSDLLAPLLCEIQDEINTFWCFVSMMRLTRFVCSPRDSDMDYNLSLLRELLRLMYPQFYEHIKHFSDDLALLFTHRWILLCFKREFIEREALHIWESCWSHYQTYYFHLFICLAIISIYGDDIMTYNMDSDEALFHFSTLSMNMNGNLILRKARGLLYEFTVRPVIPCSLKSLIILGSGSGWDSNSRQVIECVKTVPNLSNCCAICKCNVVDLNDTNIGSN